MKAVKPALLALDFHNRRVRRYFPKQTGGFLTQQAVLVKPADEPWKIGTDEGLALLDAFRTGRLPVDDLPDHEPQVA